MARYLVTSQALESHVRAHQHPGRALIRLDHEVLVAAPAKAREWIMNTYNLPYIEAGEDWTTAPSIGEQLTYQLIENGNEGFARTIIEEYLTGPTSVAKASDIAQIAADWRPDAILCDCTDIGSRVAAWQRGIPCVLLDNGWIRPLTEFQDSIPVGLRRHWRELDIDGFLSHRPPVITPCPRDLVYPDLPEMIDYRVEHPQRVGERLPAWVARLPADRPLVYASYGSILTQAEGFDRVIVPIYQRIAAALGDLHCTAILSVGRENVERLRTIGVPPNVRLTPRIDQPLLLQAGVDCIITPGGLGTVKELVTNAVPPVIIPLCSENYHIAERVVETGLGARAPFSAEPVTIAETVQKVLTESSYRHASRRWQRLALTRPSLEGVLNKLLP